MTFLPIVERELRVGARRKYTWWSRPAAAGFALALFCLLYLLGMASRGAVFSKGTEQFAVLKWMAFVFAAATGVFLTSDSLSEEKREGTLGLLFLTDLRGHDVVLGKLLSTSLQAVFGLLAAFPVLALTLLLGGVTGFEFWRAILTICNTLFLSLSVGLAVSSVSRDAIKAMNGTLLLGGFILGGLPLLDLALAGFDSTYFEARASIASPAWLFSTSGMFLPSHYWLALGVQHVLGWGLLGWASFFTPRAWQEKTTGADRARAGLAERLRFGAASARAALRRRLLEKNPVLWLVLRDRWLRRLVWVVVLASVVEISWMAAHHNDFAPRVFTPPKSFTTSTVTKTNGAGTFTYSTTGTTVVTPAVRIAFQSMQGLLMLGLSLWVASQAARFFVEGVRNGALELILVTPVTPWEIVRAQTTALFRTFLVPGVFMMLMQTANGLISILEMRSMMSASGPAPTPGFSIVDMEIAALISGLITFVTGLLSLGAFGMWMGLTNRKTSIAVLKTYCFVALLPGIALAFGQMFVMIIIAFNGSGLSSAPFWLGTVVMTGLHVAKDICFIVWSRRKLLVDFRETVGQAGRALPPMMIEAPPVVAAALPVETAAPPIVAVAPPAPPVSDVTQTPV